MIEPGLGASSSINDGIPDVDANSNETNLDLGNDAPVCEPNMDKTGSVSEDVAPVYILQPKEIVKNIDLMKTVAVLMENKLQTPTTAIKRLDEERMKDVCSDIERFPEAFHKFISIIHQIQYLNVTSDWNFSNNGESIPIIPSTTRGNVVSRLFGLETQQIHPDLAEYDARKQVLLYLLNTLQQVLSRYIKIQGALEDRLKRFSDLLLNREISGKHMNKQYNKCSNETDSDEDDPNLPLLVTSNRRSLNSSKKGKIWLEKLENLHGTLRRTKRSAIEVQDSLEVLRELVLWDYKQAISNVSYSPSSSSEGNVENFVVRVNENAYSERRSQCSQEMNPEFQQPANGRRKRMWKISALLTGILLVFVIVATLSFFRFRY